MGCASSSPLVNGGLVDSAKTAATEIINTGEKTMNGKLKSRLWGAPLIKNQQRVLHFTAICLSLSTNQYKLLCACSVYVKKAFRDRESLSEKTNLICSRVLRVKTVDN